MRRQRRDRTYDRPIESEATVAGRPMIVHYFSSSTLPSQAANSVHVMKMCDAIRRLGHEVTLFAKLGADGNAVGHRELADSYGVSDQFDVELTTVPVVPVLGSWIRARRFISRSRALGVPDTYWCRHLQTALVATRTGARVVFESHSPPASRYHRWLERRLFSSPGFSTLVVISQALAEEYRRIHPQLDPARVLVAHDGADPVDPQLAPIDDLPGRRNATRVGYTGHLYEGRGIDLILELAARCPEVDVHLVGGTESDVDRWRTRASAKGLGNIFFHGHQPAAEIPRYLKAFDIVLAPYERRVEVAGGGGDTSRWMSPLKIFEYMAAGRAIVCSRLPVLEEVITGGVNAVFAAPDDVVQWSDAVRALVVDPATRTRLGASARSDLEARYTWVRRADVVLRSSSH